MCQTHAKEVDADPRHYTAALLRAWKDQAEQAARSLLGRQVSAQALDVVVEVVAHRLDDDALVVIGTTNLPDATSLMVNLHRSGGTGLLGQMKAEVIQGTFTAGGFTDGIRPHRHGWYMVEVVSYFNGPWQQPRGVLSIVGPEGNRLTGRYVEPSDPEVEDPELLVRAVFECVAPPIHGTPAHQPSDIDRAVRAVQCALLTVDGQQSSETVGGTVAFYMNAPGLGVRGGWSGMAEANGLIRVDYSYWNGDSPALATWSVLLATGEVRYRNRAAKAMSWLPDE